MEPPFPSFSVAIPNSALMDSKSLLDKSLRVAQFARALSIFQVGKIYVYRDIYSKVRTDESKLITLLLEYLDTPQYLRKLLYPKMKLLKFAGMLPPIQSPHHKKFIRASEIQSGEVRVGILLRNRESWVVDVGLDRPIPFEGDNKVFRKSNFRLSYKKGQLVANEINRNPIDNEYGGYHVISIRGLSEISERLSDGKFLITSRRGKPISLIIPSLMRIFKDTSELILVFGSPRKDVWEIVNSTDKKLVNSSLSINMFPFQGTHTVRLEEALLGSLAIANSLRV